MYGMINDGGHTGNGLGTEQGTQAEGFEIESEPLFDEPTAAPTAMYDDANNDGDTDEEDDIAIYPGAEGRMLSWLGRPPPLKSGPPRGPQATRPRRMCTFAGVGLQLAKKQFAVWRKRGKRIVRSMKLAHAASFSRHRLKREM
jgi:hypothetical protein